MRSYRQRFLHQFAARRALLRGETRVDSDALTAGPRSLVRQTSQQRAPTGIQNTLGQSRSCQAAHVQVVDDDQPIDIGILFRRFAMKIAARAVDLQMGLRDRAGHRPLTLTALCAGTPAPLLAAEFGLPGTIGAWGRHGVAVPIGQEGL